MRTEQCQCGGYIRAASLITSRQQVAIHNMTLTHLEWRKRMGFDTPSLVGASPNDSRRHWPTADDESCDVSGNTDGASTDGVGRAS